jgi:hypothetical protein
MIPLEVQRERQRHKKKKQALRFLQRKNNFAVSRYPFRPPSPSEGEKGERRRETPLITRL